MVVVMVVVAPDMAAVRVPRCGASVGWAVAVRRDMAANKTPAPGTLSRCCDAKPAQPAPRKDRCRQNRRRRARGRAFSRTSTVPAGRLLPSPCGQDGDPAAGKARRWKRIGTRTRSVAWAMSAPATTSPWPAVSWPGRSCGLPALRFRQGAPGASVPAGGKRPAMAIASSAAAGRASGNPATPPAARPAVRSGRTGRRRSGAPPRPRAPSGRAPPAAAIPAARAGTAASAAARRSR